MMAVYDRKTFFNKGSGVCSETKGKVTKVSFKGIFEKTI